MTARARPCGHTAQGLATSPARPVFTFCSGHHAGDPGGFEERALPLPCGSAARGLGPVEAEPRALRRAASISPQEERRALFRGRRGGPFAPPWLAATSRSWRRLRRAFKAQPEGFSDRESSANVQPSVARESATCPRTSFRIGSTLRSCSRPRSWSAPGAAATRRSPTAPGPWAGSSR